MEDHRGLLHIGGVKPNFKALCDSSAYINMSNHNFTSNNETASVIGSVSNTTITELLRINGFGAEESYDRTEQLFWQFMESLQLHTNDSEVFEIIEELILSIEQCLLVIQTAQDDEVRNNKSQETWLKSELKVWKLIYALFKDRILVQGSGGSEMDIYAVTGSEKDVVTQLFSSNATLREYQIIVDWLEACFDKQYPCTFASAQSNDIGWENTQLQLTRPNSVAFAGTGTIVTSLDPDAPQREKKHLHPLDKEDNERLLKSMFYALRKGCLHDTIALAKSYGQVWRAVVLEGWRLCDNPNYDPDVDKGPNAVLSLEGNPNRSDWKKIAYRMANGKTQEEYWRAIMAALSGNLTALKSVLTDSWEDLLWGYLKVQIDIRVESELRSSNLKQYVQMPDEYWNSKMSLEAIFNELNVHRHTNVRDYAKSISAELQKYLILDYAPELIETMNKWMLAGGDGNPPLPHMLRMFAHIVIFLRQIGRTRGDNTGDQILAAYVESLITIAQPNLVAFYSMALPKKMQVELYAKYLASLKSSEARAEAFKEGYSHGLKVLESAIHAVKMTSARTPDDSVKATTIRAGEVSEFDKEKIQALELLTYLSDQQTDLVWHANSLIRYYLAEGNTECMRAVLVMVPPNSVPKITEYYDGTDIKMPPREMCGIKEHLCYQTLLIAYDSFNEWSMLMRNEPKKPSTRGLTQMSFTERMMAELQENTYRAERQRWLRMLEDRANVAKEAIYNVLAFPYGGWLIDPDFDEEQPETKTVEWENRRIQLEKLRTLWIPQLVLLQEEVLHQSGAHAEAVALVTVIADEEEELYKCYSKTRMAEYLQKLTKSSVDLLNQGFDPFGYIFTQK